MLRVWAGLILVALGTCGGMGIPALQGSAVVQAPEAALGEPPRDPPPAPKQAVAAVASTSQVAQSAVPEASAGAAQVDLVIAILTMRRWTKDRQIAPDKYLTNLVDGIEKDLSEEQKRHTSYLVYNVDKQPEEHKELSELKSRLGSRMEVLVKAKHQEDFLKESKDKVQLQSSSGEVREVSKSTMAWISGETRDATTLLFDARKRAPFVLFLEDDVRPTSKVVSKVADYLHEMRTANKDDWFMIDLYTPNISWGRNPLYAKPLERYDYECCTQAMLFRSDRLLDLLLYETLHPSQPVDDNIRDYMREDESRGIYALVPNGFEHIGKYSSNPEKSSDHVEHTSLSFVP